MYLLFPHPGECPCIFTSLFSPTLKSLCFAPERRGALFLKNRKVFSHDLTAYWVVIFSVACFHYFGGWGWYHIETGV